MPRVSVIIPTFNCGGFIERALRSVAAQTYRDYEIIVVDDGSTDNTRDIVANWRSALIYLYRPNHGLASARNFGIAHADGEFIAYLDADDMWYPEKLDLQVKFMDNHSECGLLHTGLAVIDENDAPIFHDWHKENNYKALSGHCLLDMLRSNLVQCPTVMERRSCYDRIGGFDERFKRVEDYLHWTQILLAGYALGYIDKPLAMYRWRHGSLSKNNAEMMASTVEMFRILVEEHALFERVGVEAEKIVKERLSLIRQVLPYSYRQQGNMELARRHAAVLVRELPGRVESYIQYLLSCIPTRLYEALRMVRNRFQKPNMFIREDR